MSSIYLFRVTYPENKNRNMVMSYTKKRIKKNGNVYNIQIIFCYLKVNNMFNQKI